ncbi:WS/DGAT/MGAT family O-acyltransferase [Actinomadura scrupuli]|uniref:WS/DGAT/MGAT family O-acyltransferase n=1 Tax=Actinomadura scrupuli TaxID=559629 RepID=UPI003D96294D
MDANFLHIEGGTTVAHIGGLGILDTTSCPNGRLTRGDMVELVRERAHLAKPIRQRLVEVPLGLDLPYWIDDPDFDPSEHVREVALPYPGDARQLGEEIARLHETPLDRRRPLWELYLVQGLAGGHTAIYVKVHHAAIDGVLAAETLAALLDLSPEPRPLPDTVEEPQRAPGALAMLGAGLVRTVLHPVLTSRAFVHTATHLDQIPGPGQYPGVDKVTQALRAMMRVDTKGKHQVPRLTPPPTPFNGTIGPRRRFAFGSLPLEEIKWVRQHLGGSLNDVVMALCASALRRWLVEHDALPDGPLVAAVPVSLRQNGDETCEESANKLAVMIAPLATHVADHRERFEAVRNSMRAVKRRFVASSGAWLHELSSLMPTPVASVATRLALQFAPSSLLRSTNLVVSNVPGPQIPLYVRGARILGYYPVSVISDVTGGLNITVFSYNGNIDVGIIACPDMVPDVWKMIDYMGEALDELKTLAGSQMS